MKELDSILIVKYLEGNCSEAEVEEILRWMEESEENKKELLEWKLLAAMKKQEQMISPEHIERSLRELGKLHSFKNKVRKETTRKILSGAIRYAAVFLLLVGCSWGAYVIMKQHHHPEMLVAEVGHGRLPKELVLSDGTKVWLASNSRIEYPKRFSGKQRKVIVEGQVFFDVAENEKSPFVVETDVLYVKVTGTSFEVNTSGDKEITGVILESGSVNILDKNQYVICSLSPGQQLEYNKNTGLYALNTIDVKAYTGWRDGVLEFDGLTFAEIAKILERHYHVRIVLGDGLNDKERFVGSLSYEKTIQEMLKTMEYVTSMEYNVAIDTVVYIQPKR